MIAKQLENLVNSLKAKASRWREKEREEENWVPSLSPPLVASPASKTKAGNWCCCCCGTSLYGANERAFKAEEEPRATG